MGDSKSNVSHGEAQVFLHEDLKILQRRALTFSLNNLGLAFTDLQLPAGDGGSLSETTCPESGQCRCQTRRHRRHNTIQCPGMFLTFLLLAYRICRRPTVQHFNFSAELVA